MVSPSRVICKLPGNGFFGDVTSDYAWIPLGASIEEKLAE